MTDAVIVGLQMLLLAIAVMGMLLFYIITAAYIDRAMSGTNHSNRLLAAASICLLLEEAAAIAFTTVTVLTR